MKTKSKAFLAGAAILASVILSGCAGNPPQTNQSQNQTQNNNSIPHNTCASQCPQGFEQAAFPNCSYVEQLRTENLTPAYILKHSTELSNKTISVIGVAEIDRNHITCTTSVCPAGNTCCNACQGQMQLQGNNFSINLDGPLCNGNECELNCTSLLPGKKYLAVGNWNKDDPYKPMLALKSYQELSKEVKLRVKKTEVQCTAVVLDNPCHGVFPQINYSVVINEKTYKTNEQAEIAVELEKTRTHSVKYKTDEDNSQSFNISIIPDGRISLTGVMNPEEVSIKKENESDVTEINIHYCAC